MKQQDLIIFIIINVTIGLVLLAVQGVVVRVVLIVVEVQGVVRIVVVVLIVLEEVVILIARVHLSKSGGGSYCVVNSSMNCWSSSKSTCTINSSSCSVLVLLLVVVAMIGVVVGEAI